MFEMAVGYVIGMVTGYIVFRSSVEQAHADLKNYLDRYRGEIKNEIKG